MRGVFVKARALLLFVPAAPINDAHPGRPLQSHKAQKVDTVAQIASLTTRDITGGLSLHVRVARSFTIRTRLALWMIGLAGRIMDVPTEVEFGKMDAIKPGDVVYDLFKRQRLMTVEYVHGLDAHCVWFVGPDLHRATFQVRSLTKADAKH